MNKFQINEIVVHTPNNECNLSIRDVFRLLHNPYGEKSLMNFVLGVASFLPSALKELYRDVYLTIECYCTKNYLNEI